MRVGVVLSLFASLLGCGGEHVPPPAATLGPVRSWDYGVTFVIEREAADGGRASPSSDTFAAPSPGSFRITPGALPGVSAIGDRDRILGVALPEATHQYLAADDAMLLLSDPALLERLTVERVWRDGDLTCASVTGSPGVTPVTGVCLRHAPPLVGMIERVTSSSVITGDVRFRVRVETVREHVALDAALFRLEPPPGSTDTTTEADRHWSEAARAGAPGP